MEVVCDRLALGKIPSGSAKIVFALHAAKHTVAILEPHGEQITTLVSRILGLAKLCCYFGGELLCCLMI